MDESPVASEKLQLDEQGRLDEEIACRKCGYNLRGLLAEGACPECGTAVGRSTHGDLLRFCDPAWVGTLASGMNWIVAGLVCAVASVDVTILLGRAVGAAGVGAAPQWIGLAVGLVSLIGYWKLTTPDPVSIDAERSITARSMVRIAWGTSTAMSVFVATAVQAGWIGGLGLAMIAVGSVQHVIGLIGTFAVFVYARRLALRIPDERLARSTRIVMWGLVGVMLVGRVAGLISPMWMIGASAPQQGLVALNAPGSGVMGAVCAAALGCLAIWTLILVVRYRRAMADARKQAMQSWAQPAAAVDGPMLTD